MGNSKIVFGNETLIDLTSDTVNANNLLKGATAHGANGEAITGAADMDNLVPNSGNTAIVDSDVIVTKQASDSNWYQKTFSLIWNYIKGKIGISAQGSTGKYLDEQGNFTAPPSSAVVSKTANGLAPQLPNETSTDKYLRQDGSWAVPPDTIGTYDSTARSYASDALANEAATYSSSTAYSVGQFVRYNNITYECIKATSAGTAPTNTTYWTKKKIGNKLSELNSALTNLSASFTQLVVFKYDKISEDKKLSAYNEIVIILAYGNLRKYAYIGKGTIFTDKYVQLYLIDSVPVIANVVISSNYYGINNIYINNQSAVLNTDWRVIVYAR